MYGVHATNNLALNLPATVSFQYDTNGNLTGDGLRTFVYDAQNQLTNVSVPGQWKTEFVYDGFGRRRIATDYLWQGGSWVTNAVTRYIYDGMLPIQERDGSNAITVTYTRGLDLSGSLQGAGGIGGLLARTDSPINSSPSTSYYHSDGAGNVTALVDAQQNIVTRYLYDPFGRLLASSGPLADANRYRFSSKEVHPQSGLYYYGFRYYDPSLQRWLNQDPIGESGGINLYGFVGNNPWNILDLFGLAGFGELHFAETQYDENYAIALQLIATNRRLRDLPWYQHLSGQLFQLVLIKYDRPAKSAFGRWVADAMDSSGLPIGYIVDSGGIVPQHILGGTPCPPQGSIKPTTALKTAEKAASRTRWGPEHGKGNVVHNNAIEDVLDAAERRGASDLRKNRVQRDVAGNRVATRRGSFAKPDAAWIENGVRYNFNRVSNLSDLDREVEALIKMFEADSKAVSILEF